MGTGPKSTHLYRFSAEARQNALLCQIQLVDFITMGKWFALIMKKAAQQYKQNMCKFYIPKVLLVAIG